MTEVSLKGQRTIMSIIWPSICLVVVAEYLETNELPYFFFLSELQLRGGIEDNSKIFFLFQKENICCDPSLQPSHLDGFNERSQNMFLWRNMENYQKKNPCYPFLSGTLLRTVNEPLPVHLAVLIQ